MGRGVELMLEFSVGATARMGSGWTSFDSSDILR